MEGGGPDAPLADGQTITVDAEAAPFPWELRPFSPGDRLFLAGLGGHKKVKKLFMEERVPLLERRQIPLLLCGTEVLWVCGIRRSDTARPLSAGGTEFWVVYTRATHPGQT
jgi:tRNA(Ile)-lysidine synthase